VPAGLDLEQQFRELLGLMGDGDRDGGFGNGSDQAPGDGNLTVVFTEHVDDRSLHGITVM